MLMGPGPSDIHPRVLQALAAPTVGHLDPYYLELMNDMQEMLRGLFRTKNRMTMAVSGTGSAGMESDGRQPDRAGRLDDRLRQRRVRRPDGRRRRAGRREGHAASSARGAKSSRRAISKAALAKAKPKVVGIVMAETSTGAWQPIEEISKLVHDAGALLLVDAVTALGGVPVEVDEWDIDAIYSGTQKCLSCPPGLAPVSFSQRAMEVILGRKTKVQSWYLDVSMLAKYWGSERVYHHTAPINMTYGLYEAAADRAGRRARSVLRPARAESPRAQGGPGRDRHRLRRRRRAINCRCSTPCTFPTASTTPRSAAACSTASASKSAAASAPSKARSGASA